MREAFERNGVPAADEAIDCFAKRKEFGHGVSLVLMSGCALGRLAQH